MKTKLGTYKCKSEDLNVIKMQNNYQQVAAVGSDLPLKEQSNKIMIYKIKDKF